MALAARCPHCRALFRVVADQLKLRGGLVRCGECRQVFDAIGSLSYVDDRALSHEEEAPIGGAALPGPPVPAPISAPAPIRPAPPRPSHYHPTARVSPAAAKAPPDRIRRALEPIRDELAVPTLFGAPDGQVAEPHDEDTAVTARIKPHRIAAADPGTYAVPAGEDDSAEAASAEEAEEPEAPSFLPTEDQLRAQRLRRALGIACVPLALLAVLQIGLALRNDALEAWPSLRPMLARTCRLYGCSIGWPEHAELLTIVGSELAAIPGTDVIELNAAIRSRAGFVMALPAIEVTLTDTQNRTIARKVFRPVDYLASSGEPSSRLDEGLSPGSDLSVRLVFEARGLSASGFVLYPFYI